MFTSKNTKRIVAENKLFLEDKPTQNDKFQFLDIAKTLKKTIKQAEFPIHIGLMGEWGSGKSTVIKLLEELLNTEANSKYGIKTINLWKFADDSTSLQRKIIREIQAKLNISDEEGLDYLIENNETVSFKGLSGALLISLFKSRNFIIKLSIIIIIQILLFIMFLLLPTNWTNTIFTLTGINIFIAIVIFLYMIDKNLKSNLRIQYNNKYKYLPLDYRDQFEERFNKIVKEYLKKEKKSSLILVFDDLDRLPPDQLYSALNTIKTFLYSKNCAFIVPCDEKILRIGLETAFKKKGFDVDISGFLSKTFDVVLKLPKVEETNMKVYAEELLKEEKIEWFQDETIKNSYRNVLSILIHSENNTPRKVKKILNAFASDWDLAKKRDNANDSKILTKNPELIAIYTVLKTNYPSFFNILQENPLLFREIDSIDEIETFLKKIFSEKKIIDVFDSGSDMELEESTSDTDLNKDIYDKSYSVYFSEKLLGLTSFLTKVFDRLKKDYDSRPYLYFSNKELNPITSIRELNILKEMVLNGETSKFQSNFSKLSEEQKTIFLDALLPEIYSEVEYLNTFRCLIDYPENAKYIFSSKNDWEYYFKMYIDDLVNKNNLNNVTEFLNQMDASPLTWNAFGEKMCNFDSKQHLIKTWISKSYLVNYLEEIDLVKVLNDNYLSIIEELDDYYFFPKLLFELPSNHTMVTLLQWENLLLESIKYIKIKNKEIDNEDDNEDELIPIEIPFKLIEWINELKTKTSRIVKGEWLVRFARNYDLSNLNNMEGLGEYWEDLISLSQDIVEVEYLTEGLAHINYFEELFEETIWETLNKLLTNGILSDDIKKYFIKFLKYLSDGEDYELLNEVLNGMKQVDFVTQWCAETYDFDNSDLNRAKENNIINNSDVIDKANFINKASDGIKEHKKNVVISIKRLLNKSPLFVDYCRNNGYFDVWFNLDENNIFDLSPRDYLKDLLEIYSLICNNKKYYFDKVTDLIEFILARSSSLTYGMYRHLWKEHIDLLFTHLLKNSEYINLELTIEKLQEVPQANSTENKISISSFLNSSTVEYAIPIISRRTSISNPLINKLIVERINVDNEEHLNVLVQRWMILNENDKDQLIALIENKGLYDNFIELLIDEVSRHPNMNYINNLGNEQLNSSDKKKILIGIIDNQNVEILNEWISNLFDNVEEDLALWIEKAVHYIIETRNDISPDIEIDKIRDALSYKDSWTILALKLIPIVFDKKDGKKLRDVIREKVIDLEEDPDFEDLASEVRTYFGWRNRRKKEATITN